MEDVGIFKVQWKICGILGYQIYDVDTISYKFGEKLDNPDVSMVIRDEELAIKLLKREVFEFDYGLGYKGGFKINYTEGWKIIDTDSGKKRVRISKPFITCRFNREKVYPWTLSNKLLFRIPFMLSKLPLFRNLLTSRVDGNDIGYFIPINQSIGTFEKHTLPVKVFKHFIEKASNIVMLEDCPCRRIHECQDHDHSLGCMHMGEDTKKLVLPRDVAHVGTKEEALERVKLAVENGLIPLLGRAMDEAVGFGVEDTGHFLSMCFCCPCCCIDGKILTNATVAIDLFHRMEGVTVKVNEDLCVGCEKCLEVCVFRGMEFIDGIAKVNQDRCVGCGRCESICPNEAVSIDITDLSCVDEQIKKLESHVQVS